jgi:hypothetical protein
MVLPKHTLSLGFPFFDNIPTQDYNDAALRGRTRTAVAEYAMS